MRILAYLWELTNPHRSCYGTAYFYQREGGVGIFASRFSRNLFSFLSVHSTYVLKEGAETSGYKFCVDPAWDSTPALGGQEHGNITYPGITMPLGAAVTR